MTTPNDNAIRTVTPVILEYQDLVTFGDDTTPTATATKTLLLNKIGEAFGPDGLGLLGVANVPGFVEQRPRLLKLAPQIPTLPDLHTLELPHTQYSTGWSHGREQLGPNQPDWAKGSFYANPWVDSLVEYLAQQESTTNDDAAAKQQRQQYWYQQRETCPSFYADNVWPNDSLPALRPSFRELGQTMIQAGCLLASVCDAYCEQQGLLSNTSLYETLTTSRNSKGRLLHYFDMSQKNHDAAASGATKDDMWCGWHNDHGSLTCLAPGMFLDDKGQEVTNVPAGAGLFVQTRSGQVVRVSMPPTVCGFQIGETSQIQTGGLLQATPHAVKSASLPGVTRESFAVFLEPHFDEPLEIPQGRTLEQCQEATAVLPPTVQPLRQRWKPGQTFGDFHVATISAFATD